MGAPSFLCLLEGLTLPMNHLAWGGCLVLPPQLVGWPPHPEASQEGAPSAYWKGKKGLGIGDAWACPRPSGHAGGQSSLQSLHRRGHGVSGEPCVGTCSCSQLRGLSTFRVLQPAPPRAPPRYPSRSSLTRRRRPVRSGGSSVREAGGEASLRTSGSPASDGERNIPASYAPRLLPFFHFSSSRSIIFGQDAIHGRSVRRSSCGREREDVKEGPDAKWHLQVREETPETSGFSRSCPECSCRGGEARAPLRLPGLWIYTSCNRGVHREVVV